MSNYPRSSRFSKHKATPSWVQCQKCLQRGHYTCECKNPRLYVSRPSRTQLLENPELREKLKTSVEVPNEFKRKLVASIQPFEDKEKAHSKLEKGEYVGNSNITERIKNLKRKNEQELEEGLSSKKQRKSRLRSPSRSSSPGPRALRLPAPTFLHEDGAVILPEATNFIKLLQDIRQHLLISATTRSIYISAARKFYCALPSDEQDACGMPTDSDFYRFIFAKWPTFRSFLGETGVKKTRRLRWGWVRKGPDEPNEINILSSIVTSAESAATADSTSGTPVAVYNLVIAIVVLHELSHAFTKYWFNQIITPVGVGFGGSPRSSESGFLVEDELVGGRFAVEWNDPDDFGNMDKIDEVLIDGLDHSWIVDINMANDFLSSLQKSRINRPARDRMRLHSRPSGAVSARLGESTDCPRPIKPARIGLGIYPVGPMRSYIGDDKW